MRLISCIATIALGVAPALAIAQKDKLKALPTDLGVPTSPAFELLGTTPSDVPHIVTPHDLQSNVATFFQGTHLQSGASFDARPFAFGVRSLGSYQRSPGRQWLWRTVMALGTTSAAKDSKDVALAAGIRLPLIDRGDPRADSVFTTSLENACIIVPNGTKQPDPNITLEDVAKFYQYCTTVTDSLRKDYQKRAWGALRFDVGLAGSWRARTGSVHPDSVAGDRSGVWVGVKRGLGSNARFTVGGKAIRIRNDSASKESGRYSAGVRMEWFAVSTFSMSVEGSSIWSRYRDSTALNETWFHPAVVAEWSPPIIGGWIGAAYGGDTSHRTDDKARLSFYYAFYKDQVIAKE